MDRYAFLTVFTELSHCSGTFLSCESHLAVIDRMTWDTTLSKPLPALVQVHKQLSYWDRG
jgi:hypothetical protein